MGAESRAELSSRSRLVHAVARLREAGIENPNLDAELMLAAASGLSRASMLSGDRRLEASACERFERMVARRAAREPLAYLIGRKEFYSLELEVTPAVLIPRPETELLVALALDWLRERRMARVLDLGTGSGAIALAIAANAPDAQLVATDSSEEALAVARRNASRLGVGQRISFRRADWFDATDAGGELGNFDLIVSNPPYVAASELVSLQPEVGRWEPRRALIGGEDGLCAYREIIPLAPAHLRAGGALMLEVGINQARAVSTILLETGFVTVEIFKDLAGLERVVRASIT